MVLVTLTAPAPHNVPGPAFTGVRQALPSIVLGSVDATDSLIPDSAVVDAVPSELRKTPGARTRHHT
jgi:hypothetical protein